MIGRLIYPLCGILLCYTPSHAIAQRDGAELLRLCNDSHRRAVQQLTMQQMADASRCIGYIRGLLDGVDARTQMPPEYLPRLYCIPPGVQLGQIIDVVTQHLEKTPQTRHLFSQYLVVEALKNAFPCEPRR
jgi:hypothetical protein